MDFPFWLKKMLVDAGLGHWLPGSENISSSAHTIAQCSNRVLTAPFSCLNNMEESDTPPAPDFLNLAGGYLQGFSPPGASLPRSLPEAVCQLPEGSPGLREELSRYMASENQAVYSSEKEIAVTNGATQAIQLALDSLVNPGEQVMLPDPCPALHEHLVRCHGARPIWLQTRQEEGNLCFSLKEFSSQLKKCRMALFANPGNPCGGVIRTPRLQEMTSLARKANAIILWDCTLHELQFDGPPVHPGSLEDCRNYSLIANSLSVSHGLSPTRVGWLTGPEFLLSPCKALLKIQRNGASELGQRILLDHLHSWSRADWNRTLERLDQNRHQAYQRLCGMGLDPFWPAGGIWFWLPVWRRQSAEDFCQQLSQGYQVLLRPGEGFGPSGPGYVRLSFGVEEGRLDEALRRMELYLENKPFEARGPLLRAVA